MKDDFDPYYKWLGIPPKEQPPNHYQLLGLALFESDPEVIESAADRQMTHVRTFQSGRYSAQSQEILNVLSAAKVCLLKPPQKAEYDQSLRTKLDSLQPSTRPASASETTPPATAAIVPFSGRPLPIMPTAIVMPANVFPPQPLTPSPLTSSPVTRSVSHAAASPGTRSVSTRYRSMTKPRKRFPMVPLAVGLVLVALLGVLAAVAFKFKTADGVVVVEVNELNPEIFVDGDKATVTWDQDGRKAEIHLPPGARKIELKKDGFKTIGETVLLKSGGREVITARLELLVKSSPTSKAAANTPTLLAHFRFNGDNKNLVSGGSDFELTNTSFEGNGLSRAWR